MALNVTWNQKLSNRDLYQDLPKVTQKIRKKRLKSSGYIRYKKEMAHHRGIHQEGRETEVDKL